MNSLIRAAALCTLLGRSMLAAGGERSDHGPLFLERACCANPLLTGCPDDYCRKPMPRTPCLPSGQPDDYCRKSPPRIYHLPCGEPNDYCRKPWPHLCRPLRPEQYNCGQKGQDRCETRSLLR